MNDVTASRYSLLLRMLHWGTLLLLTLIARAQRQRENAVDSLKARENQLRHKTRMYDFLSHVNQAIVRADSESDLLRRVCDVAVAQGQFREEPKHLHIEAVIWVEKDGQKAILIGKGGASLKEIGRRARLEMQKAFGCKVYLGLWVKVREGWSNDVRALKSLGYSSEED